MSNLEFVSGFGIGHILKVAIQRNDNLAKIKKYIRISYSMAWQLFYLNKDFARGLKKGLQEDYIPKISSDIVEWFDKYFIVTSYFQLTSLQKK